MRSQNVNYINVATPALSVFLNGPPQKKGVSPSVNSENGLIKPVKDAFSVDLSPSARPVTNGLSVVEGLPVGLQSSGVLQQALHCPQTKSKMAANLRSQCPQPVPQGQNLQNGNPRVHSSIFTTRRVGDVTRLQRRLLSHPYQSKLKEVPPVPLSGPNLPVSSSPFWPLYSSYGVHDCGQRGKTHGSGKEHPNAPVPGRLADPGKGQRDMFPRYPNTSSLVSGIGLGRKPQEIRAGAQTDRQFCGLPVRFDPRSSQTHPGKMGSSELQNQFPTGEVQLFGKTTLVLDRPSHCDGKTGSFWTSPHETHPMAPEEPLAHPGILGESHPHPQIPSSPPKRPARPKLAPPSSGSSDLYRHIK